MFVLSNVIRRKTLLIEMRRQLSPISVEMLIMLVLDIAFPSAEDEDKYIVEVDMRIFTWAICSQCYNLVSYRSVLTMSQR